MRINQLEKKKDNDHLRSSSSYSREDSYTPKTNQKTKFVGITLPSRKLCEPRLRRAVQLVTSANYANAVSVLDTRTLCMTLEGYFSLLH